ncbi:nucleotidyltransferase domain-containing protein [Methanococcoides orientis]|uniref:nucleotidyltransferase domain-containing protein n=1 Tax=Methanococcoides orientis TaxID=2822137 RepID=UPI001E561672|nr:nucleotidyltransferase domain-containing protein [Methanococcoides orientis]UGV41842.1 nucleotidyltransferase domain-containing protein [Methanococcoides orientis]
MIKTRIRDFIITKDDWIFAVADYFHPDGVRCILRYVPDESGDRQLNGMSYRKYDFDVSFDFMRENKPEWVQDVHIVPEDQVKQVLYPSDPVPELINQDGRVKAVADVLLSAGIPLEKMGVTGSFLPGLQNEQSDVDFVVYGNDWFRARDAISAAKEKGGFIEDIDEDMWHRIYNKRIPEISYEEFILHEKRKGNRGMVGGTYFDLLFVRDWDQINEPLSRGTDVGTMRIEATVTDDGLAFDNPSVYKVDHDEIDHVLSYTHTYAGQALEGEVIDAQGVVEQVGDIKRLVVGTSREPKGEWIRSLTLLEKNS